MEVLDIDLNEVVSKEVKQKIERLESRIVELQKNKIELRGQILGYKNSESKYLNFNELSILIHEQFQSIKSTPETSGSSEKPKSYNRLVYIRDVMNNLFGIKPKYGIMGHRDVCFWQNLAVSFYDHKEVLCNVLKICVGNEGNDVWSTNSINNIKSFVMPYDRDKEYVLKYIKAPHYCTNGAIFGMSEFYVRGELKSNIPHDLILKNPNAIKSDLFNELLKTIKDKKSNYYYLYAIARFNTLTGLQTKELGETLINLPDASLGYDEPKKFITSNLLKFNKKTLDYLFEKTTTDNQYKMFHWGKFPVKYQHKYLMDKDFDFIQKTINNYSCEWTSIEKQDFLKKYLNKVQ